MPETGECPSCGTPTEGVPIAGNVRDFMCDACAEETDEGFRAFIDRMFDEEFDHE